MTLQNLSGHGFGLCKGSHPPDSGAHTDGRVETNDLGVFPGKDILHHMHEVPVWVIWSPFVAMLTGFALAYLYYIKSPELPEKTANALRPLYLFLLNKWYFDELYDWLFVRPAKALGHFLWKGGDGAVIDGTINGTAASVGWATGKIVRLQTGYVYHYAFAMLIGVALIVTWFAWPAGVAQ